MAGPTDRPFVGRVAEREALAAQVAAAQGAGGRVVLVVGEPGVGKTRLIEEAVATVAAGRVLWGRCQDIQGAPAFWPWIQALRSYARTVSPEQLRVEAGDDAAHLARIMPGVRWRAPDVDAQTEETLDPEAARFRLFDAVTTFLRTVTTTDLLVMVLDDLHWADEESLLLLAFVADELRDRRFLVLGTYREAEIRQGARAARILGALARSSHRLSLAGLSTAEVAQYVMASCGRAAPAETVASIHRATEGNAFFVTEVVQLLRSEGGLDARAPRPVRFGIPEGVHEVIRRRVEPLSDAGRRVLAAAAVLGREFEIEVLARVVGRPPDAILRELEAGADLGLVKPRPERPGSFRFAHALLQDALVADLDADVRAELHRDVGEVLEAVYGDGLDPVLGDIAHHYFEAAPLGTLPKAIEFATLAGQRAFAQFGYEEAAGHFERALHAGHAAVMSPAARFGLLFPLGLAQRATGDEEAARKTFLAAAQVARDLGDRYMFPEAATAAAAGAETGSIDWTLIRLLEDAVALVGSPGSRRRCMLLAQLSRLLYFVDARRRHAYSEEAVAIARGRHDPVALLAALRARQFALWEPGEARRRQAIGAEILELAAATRDPMALADALAWSITDHLELADMPAVHGALRRYRELAAACRLPRVRWHVTVVEGALAQLAGRLGDARSLAQRAVTLLRPSRHNNVVTFLAVQSFLIDQEEGRLAEHEPAVTRAAERANQPIFRAARALLHAVLGQTDAAQRVLADVGAAQFTDLPRDGNLLGTYARLAEACALIGESRLAEPLLTLLVPHTDAVVVLATTVACLGSAARYAGLLAHTLGRLDDAISYFEAALATNQRIGAVLQHAHTQRELARSLRARGQQGDRDRAAALEAEAAATRTRLGAVAVQRAFAASPPPPGDAAVAPAVPAPRPVRCAASLRREGDVWTIACGTELTRIRDTKGVAYLVELLRHPGHEFHALDLGGAEDLRTGDAGEMLDVDARRAYAARLLELRDELEQVEQRHDVGRAARLREETEMLAGELSPASGLGGRARKAGSDAERARLNVTRALRKVVRKVQAECPLVGKHLDRCVQTGLFCAYQPDPAFPIDWEL